MTEKETTSGGAVWRKRAVASVSVAAAVAAVGVGFAGSAGAVAAGSVSLKLTAPTTLANNNINPGGNQNLTLEVANTDKLSGITSGQFTLNVTKPAALACASIILGTGTPGPSGGTAPQFTLAPVPNSTTACTAVSAGVPVPANSDNTFTYSLQINGAGISGTITAVVSVPVPDANGNGLPVSSNTTTSTLSVPSSVAPTFNTSKVPDPSLYNGYNFQLLTSPGDPSNGGVVAGGTTTYKAYSYKTRPDKTTGRFGALSNASVAVAGPYNIPSQTPGGAATPVNHPYINLSNGFVFDTVTGNVVFAGTNVTQPANNPSKSDEHTLVTPFDTAALSWYIVANDGQGGASTTTPPGIGGVTPPTPAVTTNDVVSPVFNSVRVFRDVAVNSFFSNAIYTLAFNGVTSGFADGTFQPGASIQRQAFAHFLAVALNKTQAGLVGTGPCTILSPSSFTDVANTNPFCQEIKGLSNLGVVNGFKDGTFHPGDAIDRQAIAAMLFRVDQRIRTGNVSTGDPACTTKPFSDVNVTNPFCGDINYLKNAGIVKGFSDGSFHPGASSERQATASFLFQLGTSEGAAYVNTP